MPGLYPSDTKMLETTFESSSKNLNSTIPQYKLTAIQGMPYSCPTLFLKPLILSSTTYMQPLFTYNHYLFLLLTVVIRPKVFWKHDQGPHQQYFKLISKETSINRPFDYHQLKNIAPFCSVFWNSLAFGVDVCVRIYFHTIKGN